MELGLSQHQAIKQIQTLSPQMYMSMEILCLNSMDLEERVEIELENNETLEREEEAAADGGDDAAATQTESPSTEDADAPGEVAEDPLGSLEDRMERAARYSEDDVPFGRSCCSRPYDDSPHLLANHDSSLPSTLVQLALDLIVPNQSPENATGITSWLTFKTSI